MAAYSVMTDKNINRVHVDYNENDNVIHITVYTIGQRIKNVYKHEYIVHENDINYSFFKYFYKKTNLLHDFYEHLKKCDVEVDHNDDVYDSSTNHSYLTFYVKYNVDNEIIPSYTFKATYEIDIFRTEPPTNKNVYQVQSHNY